MQEPLEKYLLYLYVIKCIENSSEDTIHSKKYVDAIASSRFSGHGMSQSLFPWTSVSDTTSTSVSPPLLSSFARSGVL